MRALTPRPARLRKKPVAQFDVALDAAQKSLVMRAPGRTLLVLGEAGYGKTTVALWRLERLYRAHPAAEPFRAIVIVPNEGLRDLLQAMLVKMGVDVTVSVYGDWARRRARRTFVDVPKKRGRDLTPAGIRLKRSRALEPVLEELARVGPAEFDDDDDRPRFRGYRATTADLLHLFGDRVPMERVARSSVPPVADHGVEELLEHTHVQYSRTTEHANRHVDAKRLRAIDRRSLDEGTPLADAGSIDDEDFAVLFELDRLRAEYNHEKPAKTALYDAIVVDEAQELAPLELRLIGRSLKEGGTLTVAGDANQQMDPASSFVDWPTALADLRHTDAETATLEVSYRCPPAVTAFARSVVDAASPFARTVPIVHLANLGEAAAWLGRELEPLVLEDDRMTIAVVLREQKTARHVHDLLAPRVPNRLVIGEPFRHAPGVVVTTVADVRGTEFDTVIVADASAVHYPDDPLARRTLYVASTRARHELAVLSPGPLSPILSR